MQKIRIHTDGGARGNPGPAGIGAVFEIWNQEKSHWENVGTLKRYIGRATNNQAEYQALVAALELAHDLKAEEVECCLDSELLVKQLNHEYRVKNKDLAPLFLKAWNAAARFQKVTYRHVRREYNKEADRLVNEAIDEGLQRL